MDPKRKIKTKKEIADISIKLKKKGKVIVTTNGSFDVVHGGHIHSFMEAKKFGDVLIVGLNSDKSIKAYKSKDRPIIDQKNRALLLAALNVIDYIVIYDEETNLDFILQVKPHVHVKGAQYKKKHTIHGAKRDKPIEYDMVIKHGGRMEFIEMVGGFSTTDVINKILKVYGKKKKGFFSKLHRLIRI